MDQFNLAFIDNHAKMPFLSIADVTRTRDDNNPTLQAGVVQQSGVASTGMYRTAGTTDTLPPASDGYNDYTDPMNSGSDLLAPGYEVDFASLYPFYCPPSSSPTQTDFSLSFGELSRFNTESSLQTEDGLRHPNFDQYPDSTDAVLPEQELLWNQDLPGGGGTIYYTLPNETLNINNYEVDPEAILDADVDEIFPQYFSQPENESQTHRNDNEAVLEMSSSPTRDLSRAHSSPSSKPQRSSQRRRSSASNNQFTAASPTSRIPDKISNGGRVRKSFTDTKRAKVARVRVMGACPSCQLLKTPCDDGERPCRNCIIRHKKAALGGTVFVPTKDGVQILAHACADPESNGPRIAQSLVKKIMCEGHHWHPSLHPDPMFFGSQYRRTGHTEEIRISLGFGPHWVREVEQVVCDNGGYWHFHCQQSWPKSHNDPSEYRKVENPVLPAVFTRSHELKEELYNQYLMLVQNYWEAFPGYNSPLKILNPIHELYKYHLLENPEDSSQKYASLLEEALVMLVAVHVAGDLEVDFKDEKVQKLMIFVPNGRHRSDITCCLLRSQVGGAISELVEKLLERVINSALSLAFDRRCDDFPVVFAAFYVIFVTIDSLIYHGAKIPLHDQYQHRLSRDVDQHRLHVPQDIQEGAFRLAKFYSICYPNCHAVHLLRKPDDRPSRNKTHKIPRSNGMSRFLDQIWQAKKEAQPYINERSEGSRCHATEVTRLLDRLASQFMLLTVLAPGSK